MRRILKSLLSGAFILMLGIYAFAQDNNQTTNDQAKLGDFAPVLGNGYSSDKQQIIPNPVMTTDSDKSYVSIDGDGSNIVALGMSQAFEDIQDSLHIDVQKSFSFFMFSHSASASYARQIESKKWTMPFYYSSELTLPKTTLNFKGSVYGTNFLSAFGKNAYGTGSDKDMQNFRKWCGDKFVKDITYGAKLYIAFLINCDSYYDSQTFSANAHFSDIESLFSFAGKVKAAVSVTQTISTFSGSISVLIYQIGGYPENLPNIFTKDPSGRYYVDYLDMRDPNFNVAMDQVITGIMDYATGKGTEDFPQQAGFKDGQFTGNPSPIDVDYQSYDEIGLNNSVTFVTPAVIQARTELGNYYIDAKATKDLFDHVKKLIGNYLLSNVREDLARITRNLGADIDLLEDPNVGVCSLYDHPDQALYYADAIEKNLLRFKDFYDPNGEIQKYSNLFKCARHSNQDLPGHYAGYWIPVGESQDPKYPGGIVQVGFFNSDWNLYYATGTLKFSEDKNTIYFDFMDMAGAKATGIYSKIPGTPNTYQGSEDFHDGRIFFATTQIDVPSPI